MSHLCIYRPLCNQFEEHTRASHHVIERVMAVNPTFQIIGKLEKFSDGNCGLSASFGNIAA